MCGGIGGVTCVCGDWRVMLWWGIGLCDAVWWVIGGVTAVVWVIGVCDAVV